MNRSASLGFIPVLVLAYACSVYGPELVGQGLEGAGGTPPEGGTGGVATGGSGGAQTGGGAAGAENTGGMPTGGTTSDAGGTGGTGGSPDLCLGAPSKQLPDPPDPSTIVNPDGDIGPLTFAMYRIDQGDKPPNPGDPPTEYRSYGYDLDETCTQPDPGAAECVLAPWGTGTIDGPGGTDNALGAIVQQTRNVVGTFSSENYTAGLQSGGVSVLFHVTGWNGEPNDGRVTVSTFVAAPYASTHDGGTPQWDGTDDWPIASDSINDVDNAAGSAKFRDTAAYVTNGIAVINLPRADLRVEVTLSTISPTKLRLKLVQAFATCELKKDPANTDLWILDNCIIAGRWPTNHLLQQLSQFSDPTDLTGVTPMCTDNSLYTVFKTSMCQASDSDKDVSATRTQQCNALSAGIHFTAKQALLGPVWEMPPVLPRCTDATEPTHDCCETLINFNSATNTYLPSTDPNYQSVSCAPEL